MEKDRLQAFSDGVIAILITIMVLELKVPHGSDWSALRPLVPVFLSYVLSFVNLGIYWNNHHHLLSATRRINGTVLVGEPPPAVLAVALLVLHRLDGREPFRPAADGRVRRGAVHGRRGVLHPQDHDHRGSGPGLDARGALGSDVKGKISPVIYIVAVPIAFLNHWVALALYVLVTLMWFVPDRRIESMLQG